MRALAAGLYALTAAALTLGSGGLVVAPHAMRPGTEAYHAHPAGALRYPLLLVVERPGPAETQELTRHGTAHLGHAVPSTSGDEDGSTLMFQLGDPLAQLAGAVALALLTMTVPRLPRPTRHAIADLVGPPVIGSQWHPRIAPPPPRVLSLSV